MGNLSEAQRKWLEELGTMGGGDRAVAALMAEPTKAKSEPDAKFPPPPTEPDVPADPIADALGKQNVPQAAPYRVQFVDPDDYDRPSPVKLPTSISGTVVELIDRDDGGKRSKVQLSKLQLSDDYVDNGIESLKAWPTVTTLKVSEMELTYSRGGPVTVKMDSVHIGSSGTAETFERKGGRIYPLDKSGKVHYSEDNTPNVIICAEWVRDELLRRSEQRVQIAELVNTFAKIIQMGAGHGSTVKSGKIGPNVVPKGNYNVGKGPGGKGVNISQGGTKPPPGGTKPMPGTPKDPKDPKTNVTNTSPPAKPPTGPKVNNTPDGSGGSPKGGAKGGGDKSGKPTGEKPTGSGPVKPTGKQTVKRNISDSGESPKGGDKGAGKPGGKKGGSGNKGGAGETNRRVVSNKQDGESNKDSGKGTGKPGAKKGGPGNKGGKGETDRQVISNKQDGDTNKEGGKNTGKPTPNQAAPGKTGGGAVNAPKKSVLSADKLTPKKLDESKADRPLSGKEEGQALTIAAVLDKANNKNAALNDVNDVNNVNRNKNIEQAMATLKQDPIFRLKPMKGSQSEYWETTLVSGTGAGTGGSNMRLLFKIDTKSGKFHSIKIVQMHDQE